MNFIRLKKTHFTTVKLAMKYKYTANQMQYYPASHTLMCTYSFSIKFKPY